MRRAIPWLLVVLVSAGAGLGLGLGIANQSLSAQTQISRILQETENAGSARFMMSVVITGFGTGLREEIYALGEMDFTTDSVSMSLHYRVPNIASSAITSRIIETGHFQYDYLPRFSTSGSTGLSVNSKAYSWQKEPLSSGSHYGAGLVFGPIDVLQPSGSTPTVQDLGLRTVGGKEATRYRIGPSICRTSASGITQTYSNSPSTLWVDSRGRLIQADVTQTIAFHPPKDLGSKASSMTETESIRLFDFGKPVDITAPAHASVTPGASVSTDACS